MNQNKHVESLKAQAEGKAEFISRDNMTVEQVMERYKLLVDQQVDDNQGIKDIPDEDKAVLKRIMGKVLPAFVGAMQHERLLKSNVSIVRACVIHTLGNCLVDAVRDTAHPSQHDAVAIDIHRGIFDIICEGYPSVAAKWELAKFVTDMLHYKK